MNLLKKEKGLEVSIKTDKNSYKTELSEFVKLGFPILLNTHLVSFDLTLMSNSWGDSCDSRGGKLTFNFSGPQGTQRR